MENYTGRIYKYIDVEGGLSSLKEKTIQFKKSSETNDPFECSAELIKIKNVEEYVDNLIQKIHSKWSLSTIRRERPKMLMIAKKEGISEIMNKERAKIWIGSFSRNNNNSLLRAYYAASHSGICIAYDINQSDFELEGKNVFSHRI